MLLKEFLKKEMNFLRFYKVLVLNIFKSFLRIFEFFKSFILEFFDKFLKEN